VQQSKLLKKFAGETAIYGITHTLGRFINFLLVPLYTATLPVDQYGGLNLYYAIVGFAIVVLMYGMETAFFNFARSEKPTSVFATGQISLLVSTGFLMILGLIFQHNIARFLEHDGEGHFVRFLVFILALDTLSNLPLAWLRFNHQPVRFGIIRITNILVNVGANLTFLVLIPWMEQKGYVSGWFNPDFGIGYVFVSNLLASGMMFVMLLPQWQSITEGFDKALWQKMWRYGRPLIFIGLAGIVNETLDRVLQRKLLPDDIADFEIGIYSGFYKLSMLMTLAVQSFRFAAEPFFFEQSKGENPKAVYAKVMHYFILVLSFILLGTLVFLDQIGPILLRNDAFFAHEAAPYLTPILLMANLFLGAMYNLNIWYKLNDKMKLGMYIAIGGAIATIVLNVVLIPLIGIMGSAIATLVVYAGMCFASYSMGRKHYPVPYNLKIIFFYILLALALYVVYNVLCAISGRLDLLWSFISVITFAVIAYFIERPPKNRKFAAND